MAFRSAAASSGKSTTPSVTVPTGVAANDIIILLLTDDGTVGHNGNGPASFTMFSELELSGPDAQHFSAWWKRAAAADTGTYSWANNTNGGNVGWVALALAFSGRDTTNPPTSAAIASNIASNTSPVSFTTNSVTALSGDDLVCLVAPDTTITAPGSPATTPPTGFITQENAVSTSFAWGIAHTMDNVSAGTVSATGNFSWTGGGGAGYGAWLINIPSAGGGGGGGGGGTVPPDIITAPYVPFTYPY